MWSTVLQDPQERSAFHSLLDSYFRQPRPTSGPEAVAPRSAAPAAAPAPAPRAPAYDAPRHGPPSPRSKPAGPTPDPQAGPRRPAGLVAAEQKTIGGFDGGLDRPSLERRFVKAMLQSEGPMSRSKQEKEKVIGPLAVAVPRTYAGPPPPRRAEHATEEPPGAAAEEHVRALYDYAGTAAGDLSVREGEDLVVVEHVDGDWIRCRNSSGSAGLVPATYVQAM